MYRILLKGLAASSYSYSSDDKIDVLNSFPMDFFYICECSLVSSRSHRSNATVIGTPQLLVSVKEFDYTTIYF